MWVRYLLSVGIAYLVFLILLWLWLRTKAVDYLEPGLPDLLSPIDVHAHGAEYSGKGGTFDGGGASGWYETPSDVSLGYGKDSGIGKAIDAVGDADDFAIPLVVMILVAAAVASIAVASLFVVHSAPVLFAELVVDGVLSARLLHRLRDIERRHWLETALHRTALPFAATAAIASACGWAMAQYAPEAHSIGEFMLYIRQAWWVD